MTVAETAGLQFGPVSIDVGAPDMALASSSVTSRVDVIGASALVCDDSNVDNPGQTFQMGSGKNKKRCGWDNHGGKLSYSHLFPTSIS